MIFFDTLKMAWSGITVHRNRSLLTILGIVIGITSVMAVMSLGEGAQELVIGQIQKFGPTNIFVLPGRRPNGPSAAAGTLLNDSLKFKDFEDLQKKENVPNAVNVIPYVFGYTTATYNSDSEDAITIGSTGYMAKSFDLEVAKGRFFDDVDVLSKNRVVVIGDQIREQLFGSENPIGEKIKLKDQKFTVIGVVAPQGQASFIDFNKAILAPYTAVQQDILGVRYFNRLIVEAASVQAVPSVIRDIETLLRSNHNIDDPSKDDFFIETQEDLVNQVQTITSILTVLLTAVAAISLIVGGVGIMNIMLVSVTERTREIGLRKALGATNGNVLSQFLAEALLLTFAGCIVGIAFGVGLTWAGTYVAKQFASLDLPFLISPKGVLLAVGVSLAIGIGFGFFPARHASKKNPVESLYYE